jgi:hypothetical protein
VAAKSKWRTGFQTPPANSEARLNEISALGPLKSKQNGKMKREKTRENRAAAPAQSRGAGWGS